MSLSDKWEISPNFVRDCYYLSKKKLHITEIEISLEPIVLPAWHFLDVLSTPVQIISNRFHVSFGEKSWLLHIRFDFTEHHNQTGSVFGGVPFALKKKKNTYLSQMALPATCVNTQHLSADDCPRTMECYSLEFRNMALQPIVLFTGILSWPFENIITCLSLVGVSDNQRVTSRGHPCAISTETVHSCLLKHNIADPVCRPTPRVAGTSWSSTINWCLCHVRRRIYKSYSVLLADKGHCDVGSTSSHTCWQ